jgi:GDP-D-mannose dehydratase
MSRRALITGITGQDGAYLARFLLDRGYEVHGTSRHVYTGSVRNLRFLGIPDRVSLHVADTAHHQDVYEVLEVVRPTEVYHWLQRGAHCGQWRRTPALRGAHCPWARRWAYEVAAA